MHMSFVRNFLYLMALSHVVFGAVIRRESQQPKSSGQAGYADFREVDTDALKSFLYPLPLGLPVNGTCTAGKEYVVDKISDLYNLIPEIECVWSQGIIPNKVPLGAAYGRLLSFTNSAALNWITEIIYQGDYVLQSQCNGNYYNIGVLNFGGADLSTGIWTVSSLPSNSTFLAGEHYDGKPGILMDFTVKIEDYCPVEGNHKSWPIKMTNFLPFNTGKWPYNLFIDMLRTVGRDEDNCILLLGRTWMRDPYPVDSPLFTVLFFLLKTCDDSINPEYIRGMPLPPLENSFTYNRYGAVEFLKRFEPTGYFIEKLIGTRPNGLYPYETYVNTDEQSITNSQASVGVRPVYMPDSENNKKNTINPVLQTWIYMVESILKVMNPN